MVSLFFVPLPTALGSHEFNQLLVTIFDKYRLRKVFLLLVTFKSDKITQPWVHGLPGKIPDRSNNVNSLGMRLWRSFNSILLLLVTTRPELWWWFHGKCGLLFLKTIENLEVEVAIGQIKMLVFIPYVHFIRFFSFWLCHVVVCSILLPWPRIKSRPPIVEAQSPNHWTTREFPIRLYINYN